jgi:hypothetical protein
VNRLQGASTYTSFWNWILGIEYRIVIGFVRMFIFFPSWSLSSVLLRIEKSLPEM